MSESKRRRGAYEAVGDEVAQHSKSLHAHVGVGVGEEAEDVVGSEQSQHVCLRSLVALERQVLKNGNFSREG